MSLEPIRSYVIQRVSLATGAEREMEIALTESHHKDIQPSLVEKRTANIADNLKFMEDHE